jgi:hypothetical protein
MVQFLGPETDIMCQFMGPETDIMGERYYIVCGYAIILTDARYWRYPNITFGYLAYLWLRAKHRRFNFISGFLCPYLYKILTIKTS